jgi:ATP-dependent DNA ligase
MPVSLPLKSPIQPQLARSRKELPLGDQWAYEPKYDGFRAIAFVDGDEWTIQSRSGRPLLRYFPELRFPPGRYILDGEIVIDSDDGHEDFDALQNRLHPAESRVQMLAEKTPARYVAFDILALDDDALLDKPFEERRRVLELAVGDSVDVTPLTREPDDAEPWLQGGEGVVAKDLTAPYKPGQRTGMMKVKRVRTIDAVVVGWRPGKEEGTVGSLILGLYDDAGRLHVVGHSSGIRAADKRQLVAKLEPYETGTRGHGDPSRWKSESRSRLTTRAAGASATAPRSCAGATTKRRRTASSSRCRCSRPRGSARPPSGS